MCICGNTSSFRFLNYVGLRQHHLARHAEGRPADGACAADSSAKTLPARIIWGLVFWGVSILNEMFTPQTKHVWDTSAT